MTANDETEYDLALPFVSVKSMGGPHDDDSFVAGFEMGQLDIILGTPYLQTHVMTIHLENVKQADLIAMHYDFKMESEPEDDTWTTVTFTRICTCDTHVDDSE